MMERIVVEIVPGFDVTRQYDASFYQRDGLYIWETDSNMVMVSCGVVTSLWCGVPYLTFGSNQEVSSGSGIEGYVLLKAIAIAQDPSLAVQLIR